MLTLGFVLIFILNFGISWFNAWGCGRAWADAKVVGGWSRFVVWCGAIMSACGFTWCYLFVLAFIAGSVPYHGHPILAAKFVKAMLEMGYLVIILPILGSGIGITIHSWLEFKRNKSVLNGGVAVYNTFAQVYNTVNALSALPEIFGDLGKLFDSDSDSDNIGITIAIALVVVAVLGGVMTTSVIIRKTAKNYAYEAKFEMREKLQEAGRL